MVADIARISYDPTRQYRCLVYQQGRVTLEADNNEAGLLASEALRLETIDIIGPTGALGTGYLVNQSGNSVTVGAGILYVGGWRLELHEPYTVPVAASPQTVQTSVALALLLTEQSVGAVEDQALREVALGGPDSAARTRLMQDFLPIKVDADGCAAGWKGVIATLRDEGIVVGAGLELLSSARLKAGFVPGPASKDPCTPAAAGGYLGADNQLVRVTVTEYTAASGQVGGSGKLLWGWNNASLLYRASFVSANSLQLTTIPVDQEHAPAKGQWVEILLSALDLGHNNFIAAAQGFVTYVTSGWTPDNDPVELFDALPNDYQNSPNPLFVRLWQARVDFDDGAVTKLDDVAGITVAITMEALPKIAARPFWRFAVRPSTPTSIYPQRYALAPQPPDGPRQWITELALFSGGQMFDCRVPYPKADSATGCCGVTLDPKSVAALGGLQAVVDGLAGSAAVLNLRAGTYELAAPLLLAGKNGGLTIEGCTEGVILTAGGDLAGFAQGLVRLKNVIGITLRGLTLRPPEVPPDGSGNHYAGGSMVGILVDRTENLAIERCIFDLVATGDHVFGVAIMVESVNLQTNLRGNRFQGSGGKDPIFVGIMALPVGTSSALNLWSIEGNQFTGLEMAMMAIVQLGLVSCCRNLVRNCRGGFLLADIDLTSATNFTSYAVSEAAAGHNMAIGQAAYATLRPDLLTSMMTKSAQVFPAAAPAYLADVAARELKDQAAARGLAAYKAVVGDGTGFKEDVRTQASDFEKIDTSAFDQLGGMLDHIVPYEQNYTPALRIEDNEITTTGSDGYGIAVVMSFDELGTVMASGNRVVVPDSSSIACGLLGPVGAVVTGNMFWQVAVAPQGASNQFSFSILAGSTAIMAAGNLAVFAEIILPARPAQTTTAGWDFLNSVAV